MKLQIKIPHIKKRQRYSENDDILSAYFVKCINTKKELPKIQAAASESGVSTSTISRYVRRKGFLSYEDMKSSMVRELLAKDFNDHGFVDFLMKAKERDDSILIINSIFTQALASHIEGRLKHLKFKVRIAEIDLDKEFPKFHDHDAVIGLSLSMNSARANKAIEYFKVNQLPVFMITTVHLDWSKFTPNFQFAELTEFAYTQDFRYSGYQAVRQLFNLIDDCLNEVHMKLQEE